MSNKLVTLDVREDLREGREPFGKIMQTVGRLGANDSLLLIAPFEPIPLIHVLARHGFTARSDRFSKTDWQVLFERAQRRGPSDEPAAPNASPATTNEIDLDTRGLEPPQPLILILEALNDLPDGIALRALTDRRPLHLYPQLQERGFVGETEEQVDGSFVTYIYRE